MERKRKREREKERGKGGGLGKKGLRLQCSSEEIPAAEQRNLVSVRAGPAQVPILDPVIAREQPGTPWPWLYHCNTSLSLAARGCQLTTLFAEGSL